MILGVGTLHGGVKSGKLYNGMMRRPIGNFAVMIVVLTVTVCAKLLASGVSIKCLEAPSKVKHTGLLDSVNECGDRRSGWISISIGDQCWSDAGVKRGMPMWVLCLCAIQ